MRRAGAVLPALMLAASSPAPPVPTYSLAELKVDIAPEQKIGRRQSGLICAPAGALRWRDAAPRLSDATHGAARAMRAAGLDILVPDADLFEGEGPATPVRIVATVEAIAMKACSAWHGLRISSGQAPVRASGRLVTIWRGYDQRTRLIRFKISDCTDFHVDHGAATEPAATTAAIEQAGGEVARAMARSVPDDPDTDPRLGCRVDEATGPSQ